MARLPDLPLDQVQGVAAPAISVNPTDLGLEQAGAQLGQSARLNLRVKAKNDTAAAKPLYVAFANQDADAYATDAAAYTGDHPGFAADQAQKAQARAQDFLKAHADLPAGVRGELSDMLASHVTQRGLAAGTYESQQLARPIEEIQAAQQHSVVMGGVTAANAEFAPAFEQLKLGHAATDTDLPTKTAAAFDAAAAKAVETTPPDLQGKLQLQLTTMKAQAVAEAQAYQLEHAHAQLLSATSDQIGTLTNTVASAPSGYVNARDVLLPQIVAAAPPALRDDIQREGTAQLAVARVKGLIDAGHPDQAKMELDRGDYDKALEPQQKEGLQAEALSGARAAAPASADQALAQDTLRRNAALETQALLTTGKSTGLVTDAQIKGQLPFEEAAKIMGGMQAARTAFAAAGPVREWTNSQLYAAAAEVVDPADPQFDLKAMRKQAINIELGQRQTPGAWAFNSNGKGLPVNAKGPQAAAAAISQDRGAALNQLWAETQAGVPHAAGTYAGSMIKAQLDHGIPRQSWQIVPDSEAGRLAASVTTASPDQRAMAMQNVASLMASLPISFKLGDGSTAEPRAMLARQLLAAKLPPREIAAITTYAGRPAGLNLAATAFNDPQAGKALKAKDEAALRVGVNNALAPFFVSSAPMPGAELLAQGQRDMAMTVGRHLMLTQNQTAAQAAVEATAGLTAGYRKMGTWRMPENLAAQHYSWAATTAAGPQGIVAGGDGDGAEVARIGMQRLQWNLTNQPEKTIGVPAGETPMTWAHKVKDGGHWFTTGDASGVVLMTPHGDGSWDVVADRYGRPVRASWDELRAQATGAAPIPFSQPPPNALKTETGEAVPAMSKQQAFDNLTWAITRRESGFRDGLTSDQGAMGRMQVLPETAAPYAQRLFGQPLDKQKLLHDGDYNSKIGKAYLADLVNHFHSTPEGVVLATAAYFAGQANVEGYTDARGFHPGFLQNIGDPRQGHITNDQFLARLPPKTKAYVEATVRAAALHGMGRL